MFCTNCGMQIPDDAKFCGNCGSVVTLSQQPQQTQFRTAPYAVPMDASHEVKAQAQQHPNYTIPLDGGANQHYPIHAAPLDRGTAQQYPLYTAPVDNAHQPYNYTAPLEAPPLPEAPGFVPEAYKPNAAGVSTPQVKPGTKAAANRKKMPRKKAVMVGIIAAVLAMALVMISGYVILSQPTSVWRGFLSPRAARSLQRWVLSIYQGILSLFR